jgi:hypothetical protein
MTKTVKNDRFGKIYQLWNVLRIQVFQCLLTLDSNVGDNFCKKVAWKIGNFTVVKKVLQL